MLQTYVGAFSIIDYTHTAERLELQNPNVYERYRRTYPSLETILQEAGVLQVRDTDSLGKATMEQRLLNVAKSISMPAQLGRMSGVEANEMRPEEPKSSRLSLNSQEQQ